MELPEVFVSCDWGTSNFRLRLVNSSSLEVIREHTTTVGVRDCYQNFQQQKEVSQEDYFTTYLKQELKALQIPVHQKVLVIASGMITASIGMRQLDYASVPIALTGENLQSTFISIDKNLELLLISGVKTASDVMRGEEVQAIGVATHIPKNASGILILPGTHSKHLIFKNSLLEDFTSYITGELFDIMSHHSIISLSVNRVPWKDTFKVDFLQGVQKGLDHQLMESLFSIRANSLLHAAASDRNYYYLSGLCIGSELAYLKATNDAIFLAASGVLSELYTLALTSCIAPERLTCFNSEIINSALIVGHKKIAQAHV